MNAKHAHNRGRRGRRGQGLVEYALILVLVALVAIVVASLVGTALQRIFGLTTGALGGKLNAPGVIEITDAECIADEKNGPTGQTGLVVTGFTTENLNDLTANITGNIRSILSGDQNFFPNPSGSTNTFIFHPLIGDAVSDVTLCPLSIVIQAKDKAIAVAPIVSSVIHKNDP